MEITQYVRQRPRSTAVALLLPLLAGAIAFFVLHGEPPRYTASARLNVPDDVATSASRIGIFIANFKEVGSSSDVRREVEQKTGLKVVRDGVEVTRLGQSSLFQVAYTSGKRSAVEPVLRAVVSRTFARLVDTGATDAVQKSAQDAYNKAIEAQRQYENEIGTLQPDRDYSDLSSKIRSLEANRAPGSAGVVGDLKAQRDALVPKVRRAADLDQDVKLASSRLDDAKSKASRARKQSLDAQSPSAILDLSIQAHSSGGGVGQGVAVAAVLGLLGGIAVLVLPDLLRAPKRADQRARLRADPRVDLRPGRVADPAPATVPPNVPSRAEARTGDRTGR